MAEVGSAYVTIVPTSKGATKDVTAALGGEKAGRKAGSKIMAGFKKAAKIGAIAAAGSVAVIGGAAFKAATGIDTASKTLAGLYGDATEAEKAMSLLRDVAKDSPIDYQSFLKAGEGMAYLGLKADDAAPLIQNIGKAIVGFGGGSAEMQRANDAITRMASEGKVTQDTLSQLSNTGVPIFDSLAESIGVSNSELADMVTKGKVGLDDVVAALSNPDLDAMAKAIQAGDGAGDSFANTWKKVKDNVLTSLAEFMLPLLDKMAPTLQKVGAAVSDFVEGMRTGEGPGGRFMEILTNIWNVAKNVFGFIAEHVQTFTTLAVAFGVAAVAAGIFNAVMAANPISLIIIGIGLLVGAIIALVENWDSVVAWISDVWNAFYESTVKPVVDAIAAIFQWLWDHAIKPIVDLYIGYFKLLASVVLWLWDHAVKPAFDAIGKIFTWIWDTIIKPIVDFISDYIDALGKTFTWLWENAIKPAFDAIGDIFDWIWNTVIKPIGDFISDKIDAVGDAFKAAWELVIKPALDGVGNAFQWLWDHAIKPVADFISDKIDFMSDAFKIAWDEVIKPALDGIGDAFQWVWDHVIKPVADFISDKVSLIGDVIGDVFGTAADIMQGAFDGVVDGIKGVINGVIGLINGAIGGINKMIDTINLIPGVDIGHLGTLPMLAAGGTITGSGSAIVGENGPELVTLPKGATVNPNIDSGGFSLTYNAAPNKSIDRVQDLRRAMTMTRAFA